jgi:hypothetical protein
MQVRELLLQPLEVRLEALELGRRRLEVYVEEGMSARWKDQFRTDFLGKDLVLRDAIQLQLRDELRALRVPSLEQLQSLHEALSHHIQRLPSMYPGFGTPHGRWTWTRGKLRAASGRAVRDSESKDAGARKLDTSKMTASGRSSKVSAAAGAASAAAAIAHASLCARRQQKKKKKEKMCIERRCEPYATATELRIFQLPAERFDRAKSNARKRNPGGNHPGRALIKARSWPSMALCVVGACPALQTPPLPGPRRR